MEKFDIDGKICELYTHSETNLNLFLGFNVDDITEKICNSFGLGYVVNPYPILIYEKEPEKICYNNYCKNVLIEGFYDPSEDLDKVLGINKINPYEMLGETLDQDLIYELNMKNRIETFVHEYLHKIEDECGFFEKLQELIENGYDYKFVREFIEGYTNVLMKEIGLNPKTYHTETFGVEKAIENLIWQRKINKPSDLLKNQYYLDEVYNKFYEIYEKMPKDPIGQYIKPKQFN